VLRELATRGGEEALPIPPGISALLDLSIFCDDLHASGSKIPYTASRTGIPVPILPHKLAEAMEARE
jgi:hypothetical protein